MKTILWMGVLMTAISQPTHAMGQQPPASMSPTPPELGRVAWLRDFDAALGLAAAQKKPVFLLFQEIPGCATCKNYGGEVLSHPLLIEAMETEFVPVVIRNNTSGDAEERIRKSFDEPAWNNPVARLISADRKDLVPRLDGVYSVDGVAARMVEALAAADRTVPAYLRLLADESAARRRGLERATFGMRCFWEGEARLGEIAGVMQTRPGFVGGMEVVEVEFDPRTVTFEMLVGQARTRNCATRIFARTDGQFRKLQTLAKSGDLPEAAFARSDEPIRPDKEPKYYLSKSPLRFVPMTEAQACGCNTALAFGLQPEAFLSPRQIALGEEAKRNPPARGSAIGEDIRKAWPAKSVECAAAPPASSLRR